MRSDGRLTQCTCLPCQIARTCMLRLPHSHTYGKTHNQSNHNQCHHHPHAYTPPPRQRRPPRKPRLLLRRRAGRSIRILPRHPLSYPPTLPPVPRLVYHLCPRRIRMIGEHIPVLHLSLARHRIHAVMWPTACVEHVRQHSGAVDEVGEGHERGR